MGKRTNIASVQKFRLKFSNLNETAARSVKKNVRKRDQSSFTRKMNSGNYHYI